MDRQTHSPASGVANQCDDTNKTRTKSPLVSKPIFKTEMHHSETNDVIDMHPIMAAAFHNRTKSPLGRLPDTILIKIMELSDIVANECLRRCSRTFLRLSPVAFPERFSDSRDNPWPVSKRERLPEEKEALLALVAKDEYCSNCSAARRSPNWANRVLDLTRTYLHCSGCRADHPACLFSATERDHPQSARICIGHEGRLRLCQHVEVAWSEICKMSEDMLHCGTEEGSGELLIQCDRRQHAKTLSDRGSIWTAFQKFPCRNHTEDSESENDNVFPYPAILCSFETQRDRRVFEVATIWSGHLSMRMRSDGHYHAADFEKGLETLYEHEGKFICPSLSPGPLPGSTFCNPGDCDCLTYSGKDWTAWERPPADWTQKETCRLDPSIGLYHSDFIVDPNLDETEQSLCWKSWDIGSGTYGTWDQAAQARCGTEMDCVLVTYQSTFSLALDYDDSRRLRRMDSNWFHALDPDSYNLTQDSAGFGVSLVLDE